MILFYTASQDATIYLQQPYQNTGIDEMLELSKVYYPNSKKIINIILKDLKLNKIDIPEPTFNEIHLNPDYFMNKKYKIKKIY